MGTPRCLLLVKSVHHGNTARVAEAMAGVLGAQAAKPESVPYKSLSACGLVGFGSGVYYGRMDETLFNWLRGLPYAPEANQPVFVLSTSGLPFLASFWHWSLHRLLARKGFRVVGAFACRGFDTWGPLRLTGGLNRAHPDEHDLARARKFAAAMAQYARPLGTQPCSP